MNEETVGNSSQVTVQAQEASFKRQRGTFFGGDLEKEVSAFKNDLFNLTNYGVVLADVEFSEINRI